MKPTDLQAQLVSIEKSLWTSDARLYRERLLDDALLLFEETGLIDRAAAIQGIEAGTAEGRAWSDVRFSDVRLLPLNDDAVVLTYRVAARLTAPGPAHRTYATSVYVRQGEDWKLAFHQQTADG